MESDHDNFYLSDTSESDMDMPLHSSPMAQSPLSVASPGNGRMESPLNFEAPESQHLENASFEPESESDEAHLSPSPLTFQPLLMVETPGVGDTDGSGLQLSLDTFSAFETGSFYEETGLPALPSFPSDPDPDFQPIGENETGHILALSPQLASIPEETGCGATQISSFLQLTPVSTSTHSWLSQVEHGEDEGSMLSVPTEQVSGPTISISGEASGSHPLSSPRILSAVPSSGSLLSGSESQPTTPEVEVETDDSENISDEASTHEGGSSVFDDEYFSDTSSHTASLLSDVKDYSYENGRRYHSYREGHYVLPNDDQEQDRQDLLHHVRNLVLSGALFRAPINQNLQRALDIGTGTGIWAIDFADSYPSAEVMGTDLSPIQPSWVPPNLRFHVDDAESPWLFSANRPFDFIHARDLGGAIADWPRLLLQAHEHLRPGGWVELQEFEVTLRSDDDSMPLAPMLCEFLGRLHEASEAFHRPMNIAEGHGQRLVEAGFEDVRDEVYKVPSSEWPTDPIQKQIGRYNLCSLLMAVESYSLALFTRVLGWSNLQTQVFLAGVRRDLKNPDVHTYCNLHIVYGQKPEHAYHTSG
ncbi:hypothetical protein N7466_003153 [Penicillium verhagenii]|uniref:uncharacterized protein n=1 Tax=Penicillium verhagenii TaxID=1562060 RepID=UPI002545B328|nr:uncharacterized protein N7466_003153 [Penicillium verhagenii]KAJ5936703.1 hypothetical protein N7466_003153 [Penicillium verhagenii]